MRTVTYGAACSLDGFITARDGALDWLHFSPDVQEVMNRYWSTVDTILMGRKTFEIALASAPTRRRGKASKSQKPSANPYEGLHSYVFSRTLDPSRHPEVHIVRHDAGAFVRQLKAQAGKGICVMGGGELAQSLLQDGVVDEVGLNIHPVLLGSGTPLFRDAGRIALELVESRVIAGGCVIANYRVLPVKSADRQTLRANGE